MPDLKQIFKRGSVRFVVIFAIAYSALQGLGYVHGIENAYRNHYIRMTDSIFDGFKGNGIVKANPNDDEEEKELDVMIMLSSKELYEEAVRSGTNVRIARTYIFTKFLGYFPFCIFLALLIATPLGWKQKLIAGISGLLLVQAFVIMRLWLHLLYSFNNYEWLEVITLSPFAARMLDFFSALFISNVVVAVLVPVLIYMLVAVLPFPRSVIHSRMTALLRPG